MADSSPTQLEHALAEYRAAMTLYPSAHEKALLKMIGTLAEEVIALRRDSAGGVNFNSPAHAGSSSLEAASDVQALQAEVGEIRRYLERNLPTNSRPRRNEPVLLPSGSAPMRPVEELIEDAPQIEQELSPDQLKAHLKRPRVRAEDIVLSPDDLVRQTAGRQRTSVSLEQRQQLYQDLPKIVSPLKLLLGMFLIMVVFCFLFALLSSAIN